MHLEYQQILYGILTALEHLAETLRRETFRIYVGDLVAIRGDVARQLETYVSLAGTGLAIDQRDAPLLNASSEEHIEVGTSQRYPIHGPLSNTDNKKRMGAVPPNEFHSFFLSSEEDSLTDFTSSML